jgi:hypothetical protein
MGVRVTSYEAIYDTEASYMASIVPIPPSACHPHERYQVCQLDRLAETIDPRYQVADASGCNSRAVSVGLSGSGAGEVLPRPLAAPHC